jgi:hypothetical protein
MSPTGNRTLDFRGDRCSTAPWTTCEIPRDGLFSDDFGFKINTNLAHIFILRRPLIILFKNIEYLEGNLHFRRCKPWKLGVNHPTIGISQKVHSYIFEFAHWESMLCSCQNVGPNLCRSWHFLYQQDFCNIGIPFLLMNSGL